MADRRSQFAAPFGLEPLLKPTLIFLRSRTGRFHGFHMGKASIVLFLDLFSSSPFHSASFLGHTSPSLPSRLVCRSISSSCDRDENVDEIFEARYNCGLQVLRSWELRHSCHQLPRASGL